MKLSCEGARKEPSDHVCPDVLWCEVKAFEIRHAHFVDTDGRREINVKLKSLISQLQQYRIAADRWHMQQLKKMYFLYCSRFIESIAFRPLSSKCPGYIEASCKSMLSALCSWKVPAAMKWEISMTSSKCTSEKTQLPASPQIAFETIQRNLLSSEWYREVSLMRPLVTCILTNASNAVSDEIESAGFGVILSAAGGFERRPSRLRWTKMHSIDRRRLDTTTINVDTAGICLFVTSLFDLTGFARHNKFLRRSFPSWVTSTKGLGSNRGMMDGATTEEHLSACTHFRRILSDFSLVACESIVRNFEGYLNCWGTSCEKTRWFEKVKDKRIKVVPDAELEFDFSRVVTHKSPDGFGCKISYGDAGHGIFKITSDGNVAGMGARAWCHADLRMLPRARIRHLSHDVESERTASFCRKSDDRFRFAWVETSILDMCGL